MNKLIFCDIDGTILDRSRGMDSISEKTRYAINELKKTDHVVIASGRCKGLLSKEILGIEPGGFILCNGAYCEMDGKRIYAQSFSREQIEKITEIPVANGGFYILETLDEMYVDSLTSRPFLTFLDNWGKALTGFEEVRDLDQDYHIAMIGFENEEQCRKTEKELGPYVDLARHNKHHSYDVNIPGISKGNGVRAIIDYLQIPFEDTYCFGDGINDLEMLEEVAHPVIMENANPALKGRGFEETADVLDDGFYEYLVSNKLINAL